MKRVDFKMEPSGAVAKCHQGSFVTLKTSRLEIQSINQITKDELKKSYTALFSDSENIKLFREGNIWSEWKTLLFLRDELSKWHAGTPFGVFSVYHAQTHGFMGTLIISSVDNEYTDIGSGHKNAIEIAYVLDKSYWGAGYGSEIAQIASNYVEALCLEQKTMGMDIAREIVATVDPSNKGSVRILQKVLKNQEPDPFVKYEKQRVLFFKPILSISDRGDELFSPISRM